MKKFILLTLLVLTTTLYAQDRVNKEKMIVDKTFASLKKAKGWRYRPYSGEWYDSNNDIFSIDKFNKYDFRLATYNAEIFLCLRKEYTIGSYKYKYIQEGWSTTKVHADAVVSLEEYKKQISNLKTDNIIKLPLLHYNFISSDSKTIDISSDDETNYKNNDPRRFLVLKFRLNKEKKTARFLFYVIDRQESQIEGLHQNGTKTIYSFSDEEEFKIITSDALYENLYYEMPLDKFLEFIQAPLHQ